MSSDRERELRERIGQLLDVIAGFEVTGSQLEARKKMNPTLSEIDRKTELNRRTLHSLQISLEQNREELRLLLHESHV